LGKIGQQFILKSLSVLQHISSDTNPRSGGGAFPQREQAAPVSAAPTSQPPSRPKVNPFGAAIPRDEVAIQKQIEERRLAREKESAVAAAVADQKKAAEKASADAERLVLDQNAALKVSRER
jgi:hypothetical protein